MRVFKNIYIVHPGTHYAFRLANAITRVTTAKISYFTSFTLSETHPLAKFKIFRKRVKPLDKNVKTYNFPFFEAFLLTHLKFNSLFKKSNNNPYYYWQILFGWFLLPIIYLNRKNALLITFETCGWPLTKYAKKWGIPVIMDFPSISHEKGESLGIVETTFGKKIKNLERQQIDYAISCSFFAKNTYENLTSAKEHFAVWLGTDFKARQCQLGTQTNNSLNIACLANTELRKGIDLLLEAFNKVEYIDKKLYFIGNLNPVWIRDYCKNNNLSLENIILTGPKAQQDLKDFLIQQKINLHILPSRFDSFGMVVPETMALGIPNILSPYVGAGEMIEHYKDGFVMENLNANELANYINEYINMTDDEKLKFSQAALKKSREMTWDNYTQRINLAFQKIIQNL